MEFNGDKKKKKNLKELTQEISEGRNSRGDGLCTDD